MATNHHDRNTTVLYTRIPRATHDAIEAAAKKLGWPNTIASVSCNALVNAFKASPSKPRKSKPSKKARK